MSWKKIEPLDGKQMSRAKAALKKVIDKFPEWHQHDDGLPEHAIDGPSGFSQIDQCPASVSMQADNPSPETQYSYEGSVAHDLWERSFKQSKQPHSFIGQEILLPSNKELEIVPVNYDMADHIEGVIDYCAAIPGQIRLAENKVTLEAWAKDCFGSVDHIIAETDVIRRLHVLDLKYGTGVPVRAPDTPQPPAYALGAVWAMFKDHELDWDEIVCHILQPRLGSFTTVTYSIEWLMSFGDYLKKRLKYARTQAGMKDFRPSVKTCQFCGAKGKCKARADHYEKIAQEGQRRVPVATPAKFLAPEDYSRLLTNTDGLTRWANGIERSARDFVNSTQEAEIPGFKIVDGRSYRDWPNDKVAETTLLAAQAEAARSGHQVDIYKKKLLSPAQAEEAFGKVLYEKLIEQHVRSGNGAKTVVPISDSRPETSKTIDVDTAQFVNGTVS
jgi:hypothetical protein